MTKDELISLIKCSTIMIYGSGYVAELFYKALVRLELQSKVGAVLVSAPSTKRDFHSLPILTYQDTDTAKQPIILALHPANLASLTLKEEDTVIDVYPFLWDLLLGDPIREEVVDLEELLSCQDQRHDWLAIRYAGVKAIAENDDVCSKTYLDAMSLHCGIKTAEKRFAALKKLYEDISLNGLAKDLPVCITADGKIIDGLHRIAIARYLNIPKITCRIYEDDGVYYDLFNENNYLPDDLLQEHHFDMEHLHDIKRQLFRDIDETVSLILPVYNVENYIDQCLETVVSQTYPKLDIILINDGSKDGSLAKCYEWASRDERIRVFDQENHGVAYSRNKGICLAKGSIIGFVDPDDWLDLDYVRKLKEAMKEGDYVECDLWRYDDRSGKQIYRSCASVMKQQYTLEQRMRYGPTATYKALSRKILWQKNGLHMPSCSFESPAVYSLVLSLSKDPAYLGEALYYYRRFRPDSLIETGYGQNGRSDPYLGIEAMRFLKSEYIRTGIHDRFRGILPGIIKYRLSDILAMQYHRRSKEDYQTLVHNYLEYIQSDLPDKLSGRYLLYGSYTLDRICMHLYALHDPDSRFNFSSIISLLKEEKTDVTIEHKNAYRRMMVQRELDSSFFEMIWERKPAYLFMDLLEERHDILDTGSRYITLSDAYEGCTPKFEGRTIKRDSQECLALFKDSFRKLSDRLSNTRIIMIENYLSERKGNIHSQEPFPELEDIRRTNAILKTYYDFIRESYPAVTMIETAGLPLYFTDARYEYGAIPSHLNELVNARIAELIEKEIAADDE